jgi:exodeoxyribonuclease-3
MAAYFGWPDLLSLQEVRIRAQDEQHVRAMQTALPSYRCYASLPRDPENVRFRGGRAYGVVTYVREDLPHFALERPEWDREGRLVTVVLPEEQLVVGNVYAVNGTDKPYFDHELGRSEGDRHVFKRRFQSALLSYFNPLRGPGMNLVLLADWNVSRSAQDTFPRLRSELPHALARAMFNDTLMPGLDVFDPYRELHPDAREYTWCLRGARRVHAARVDFALLSRALESRLHSAAIMSDEGDRFYSDHSPITLRLRSLAEA